MEPIVTRQQSPGRSVAFVADENENISSSNKEEVLYIEEERKNEEEVIESYVVLETPTLKLPKPAVARQKLNLTSIVLRGSSRRKVRRGRRLGGYVLSVTSEGWEEPIQISSSEFNLS